MGHHYIGLPKHQGHTVLKRVSSYTGERFRELLKEYDWEDALNAENIMRAIFSPPAN